jgi:arylsulfatase
MEEQPPNSIRIMTDQQNADTIHALGYDYIITPGMDRIVRHGVSFRWHFSCGATCIASRAARDNATQSERRQNGRK